MTETTRILTIEDDAIIRGNIVAYLEDNGYEMLEASDGQEGLELFLETRPDVVLCDLRMPKLDGLEVLQKIAQASPDTPVIIVSGAGMIADAIHAMQHGAWDFITKPIPDMQVLDAAVEKALDRARLLHENREYQRELERVNRELSNALQQLKADQEAGREVQAKLLPADNQDLSGFVFHRRLYPATYLSGDFVDYFSIDNRHIGFYMADVSGHDTGSAFVTVIVKTLMTQLRDALEKDQDETILAPARTLDRINEELYRQELDKYITIFYGVIDVEENRMRASNGGQFPYPILFDGRNAREVNARSRPVGLFESVQFPSKEVELPQNFQLLLVSDGIFELMPEKSNKEQYEDLLTRVANTAQPLEDIAAEIELNYRGQLADDVTLLAIHRQTENAG